MYRPIFFYSLLYDWYVWKYFVIFFLPYTHFSRRRQTYAVNQVGNQVDLHNYERYYVHNLRMNYLKIRELPILKKVVCIYMHQKITLFKTTQQKEQQYALLCK